MPFDKEKFVDGIWRAKDNLRRVVRTLTRKEVYLDGSRKFNFFLKKNIWLIIFFALFLLIGIQLFLVNQKINKVIDKMGGPTALECIESQSIEKTQKATVLIIGGESEGTGFFIRHGFVITNLHVVALEPSPKIVYPDKSFDTGEVIWADAQADMAIVKVNRTNIKPLKFNENVELVPSSTLIAVGFPAGGNLPGDSSVIKGSLSAIRTEGEYLQFDKDLIPGMSGGPMITECGDVVGINQMTYSNLGFALSTKRIRAALENFLETGWSDIYLIKRIDFKPNDGPLEAVKAFYNYLKIRDMEKAFALMSDYLKGGLGFEVWKQGYDNNLDTTVLDIELMKDRQNVVKVRLGTKDLIDEEVVYKFFEGRWQVKKINGQWQLWSSFIKEIDPETGEWIE